VQDVRLRLLNPLGELFYDSTFGSLCHEFYLDELTTGALSRFTSDVRRRIEEDPRVILGSAACRVIAVNVQGFSASAVWEFIGTDHPFNLVFTFDAAK